jgi:hypothetical protein
MIHRRLEKFGNIRSQHIIEGFLMFVCGGEILENHHPRVKAFGEKFRAAMSLGPIGDDQPDVFFLRSVKGLVQPFGGFHVRGAKRRRDV